MLNPNHGSDERHEADLSGGQSAAEFYHHRRGVRLFFTESVAKLDNALGFVSARHKCTGGVFQRRVLVGDAAWSMTILQTRCVASELWVS